MVVLGIGVITTLGKLKNEFEVSLGDTVRSIYLPTTYLPTYTSAHI